jgi:hypothetical protein
MRDSGGILLRSLRDLLRWVVLREVLITGIPLLLLWIVLASLSWERLLAITTEVIGWIPFSIVRADGAMFILFFVWAIAVLVSFSFITAIIAPLFFKRIRKSYYYYSFISLLLLSAGWGWLFIANWQLFKSAVADKLLLWLPFQTVAEGSAWLLNFYLFYSLYILSLYLVLALYRKDFLYEIKELEYPEMEWSDEKIGARRSFIALRDASAYIVLSIALFPLLFVPFVNILIQLFLWAWLYRDANFIGTCRLICSEREFAELKEHRFTIWSIAFFASILNFIPIINMFTPFFAQIMAFHWIMQERKSIKAGTDK